MAAVSESRQPVIAGTAFALRDAWPWPAFARLAGHGERLGYRAVFLPEIAGRDAFAALTGLAGETSGLLLGTGIVPITSRRSSTTAMGAATAHERSGGRFILGLGAGAAGPGALDELRSHVDEIRALLDASVGGDGGGGVLGLDRRVPIWIAALGPRAVALAGRIADGVLLNWCTPERVADARAAISEAARAEGRDPRGITVAAYVRAAIGEGSAGDEGPARLAVAAAVAEYASYPAYRRQFEAMGLGEAAAAAGSTRATGRELVDAAAPLLDRVCLTGRAGDARARLDAYRAAGCDLPVVYPVPFGDDPESAVVGTLTALGPAP
jgi:alkanesulfonate monooxygenase SsuD/methylene tetrahydromethanopterin reductase-like flavin-dependent oxidoreductase (luciferase family)